MKKLYVLLVGILIFPAVTFAQWTEIEPSFVGYLPSLQKGFDVAMSSDGATLAIGVPLGGTGEYETDSYVQVFHHENGVWSQVGENITGAEHSIPSNMPPAAGYSVDITPDGNIVAVGEPNYYLIYEDEIRVVGRVRLFENIAGAWEQIGGDIYGLPDFESGAPYFGSSVAISSDGNIVAIGGRYDNIPVSHAGEVQVYKYEEGDWEQMGETLYGQGVEDNMGWDVALSGDGLTLAVGVPGDDEAFLDAGKANLYQYESGQWQEMVSFAGIVGSNRAGTSVALSVDGSILAIGGNGNSSAGADAGNVRVYQNVLGNWEPLGEMLEGALNDRLGLSIDLSDDGSRLAVGFIPLNALFLPFLKVGTVCSFNIYEYDNQSWGQVGNTIEGTHEGSRDLSLAISSDASVISVGMPNKSVEGVSFAGKVSVYQNCDLSNISIESANPEDICAGVNTILSAGIFPEFYSNSGNINWYENESDIEPIYTGIEFLTEALTETTSYWVQSESPMGCFSEALEVAVEVIPAPDVPEGESVQSFFDGVTFEDIDVTAVGVLVWYTDEALTQEVSSDTELENETTYYVTQSIDGCESEALTITVFTNLSTGQLEIPGFTYYPNPAYDEVYLISEKEYITSLRIVDLTGKVVIRNVANQIGQSKMTVNVGNLPQGVYLVEVESAKSKGVYRLVKQ